MDSLYHVLEAHPGIDFKTLVNKHSDDKKEFWMGWLQTSQEFEEVAFSLKDGEYSKPFFTPKGIQIIKVTGRREIPPFEQIRGELIHKLSRRPGTDKEIELWVNKLKSICQYTPDKAGIKELLASGRTSALFLRWTEKALPGKTLNGLPMPIPWG